LYQAGHVYEPERQGCKYWMDKEKVPLERLLVIVDDLALPLSRLRLRRGGSDAGHNGLKDIIAALGTTEYPRLRFGIGHNYQRGKQIDFVLAGWKEDELPIVKKKIEKCSDIIRDWAFIGIEKTMNETNNLKFL